MKNKGFLVALLVFLLLVVGGYYYSRQYRQNAPAPLSESLPVTEEEESVLESQVGIEIPQNIEKTKLADVSGGEASGIATRKFEEGEFKHDVIANLPEPEAGQFYQGWLVKEEEAVPTGKMEQKKGGWVLSYTSGEDQSDYDRAVITLESKDDDQPEDKILEGKF